MCVLRRMSHDASGAYAARRGNCVITGPNEAMVVSGLPASRALSCRSRRVCFRGAHAAARRRMFLQQPPRRGGRLGLGVLGRHGRVAVRAERDSRAL